MRLGNFFGGDRAVESFLGRLSPLYNEVAADGRYLSERAARLCGAGS